MLKRFVFAALLHRKKLNAQRNLWGVPFAIKSSISQTVKRQPLGCREVLWGAKVSEYKRQMFPSATTLAL